MPLAMLPTAPLEAAKGAMKGRASAVCTLAMLVILTRPRAVMSHDHMSGDGLADMDDAGNVRRQQTLEFHGREVFQRGAVLHSVLVDQDVDRGARSLERVNGGADGVVVGHIEAKLLRAGNPRVGGVRPGGVAAVRHHLRARRRQCLRQGLPMPRDAPATSALLPDRSKRSCGMSVSVRVGPAPQPGRRGAQRRGQALLARDRVFRDEARRALMPLPPEVTPDVPEQAAIESDAIAQELRLNAAAFIVTVYGDVVVPRGGVLWTGTLIDLCARVGINESLVRTAISRLVAASRLEGERIGRRSYYRLRSSALAEFMQAADLLYGPDRPARGWQIIHDPDLRPEDARRQRMGHMGGSVFLRPDRGQPLPEGALVFHAEAVKSDRPLAGFWDLSALHDGYGRFMDLFGAVDPAGMSDEEALVVRLLLVHGYRTVLLRDPRLPEEHLPEGWNGAQARALFRRLYLALTPGAQRHVAVACEGVDGVLPAETAATEQRLKALLAAG